MSAQPTKPAVTVQAEPTEQAGLPILKGQCPVCSFTFATAGHDGGHVICCGTLLRFVDRTKPNQE